MSLLGCQSLYQCFKKLEDVTNISISQVHNTDLAHLLTQSSNCRECAKYVKHPLTKIMADKTNTLFCESFIKVLTQDSQ